MFFAWQVLKGSKNRKAGISALSNAVSLPSAGVSMFRDVLASDYPLIVKIINNNALTRYT